MKILIIRLSSIGDIVLTTPVVRCLKKQVTGAEIHYLCKAAYAPMLQANVYIDHVHVLKEDSGEGILTMLSKIKFEYIIDLHHNLRSFFFKRKLSGKAFSFYKANIEKWLMVNFKLDRLPRKHIIDRYLDTVKQLGVIDDRCGMNFFIPPEDHVDLNIIDSSLSDRFIAIVLGAKFATKKYPSAKIIELCKNLEDDIILVGGPEDATEGEAISASRERIYNCCGKLSINQSASVIKQSYIVISNDTGMMHIAAALEKDIISLWGNTIPAFGMYPYYKEGSKAKSVILENKELSCRPCSKIGYQKCPKGHFKCMEDIKVESVLAAIR